MSLTQILSPGRLRESDGTLKEVHRFPDKPIKFPCKEAKDAVRYKVTTPTSNTVGHQSAEDIPESDKLADGKDGTVKTYSDEISPVLKIRDEDKVATT